jgi:hypothetical protein
MSKRGIAIFSQILSDMQESRIKLVFDGNDTQDVLLGQLLEKMKESCEEEFCKITMME